MKIKSLALATIFLAASGGYVHHSFAHHSFAPHFDADKPVSIFGTITEYEQRNPHAYLNIRAEDADGRMQDYRCESHGWTQLSRNGITPDMLKEGSQIGITGSQHRRDENMCFFDTVFLEDGRELDVNGPRNRPQSEVAQRDSFFGTWLISPTGRSTSGPQSMMDYLTPEGRAAVVQYNPFTDDPTYRCEPVAIRRAWFAPGTPMAIRQSANDIVIQHEWMDAERIVHMNIDSVPEGTESSILGYSIGHYEGDTLVIETTHYTQCVLNQFVTVENEPMRALLRSDQLRTVERITFLEENNRFRLSVEHYDPKFFTIDFPVVTAEFSASDMQIDPFACIPEILI
jgi:hypothetical protein